MKTRIFEPVLFFCGNRCQLREKDSEIKELKEQMNELVGILRLSEARRKETEKQLKSREHAMAAATTTPTSVSLSFMRFIKS